MTDLRDRLAEFEHAARRLLAPGRGRLAAVHDTPATCHPARELYGRTLCRGCYDHHRNAGDLDDYPRTHHPLAEVVADYELLRSEGHTRDQIAQRLGMRRNTLDRAVQRAIRAGALEPDRRTA